MLCSRQTDWAVSPPSAWRSMRMISSVLLAFPLISIPTWVLRNTHFQSGATIGGCAKGLTAYFILYNEKFPRQSLYNKVHLLRAIIDAGRSHLNCPSVFHLYIASEWSKKMGSTSRLTEKNSYKIRTEHCNPVR